MSGLQITMWPMPEWLSVPAAQPDAPSTPSTSAVRHKVRFTASAYSAEQSSRHLRAAVESLDPEEHITLLTHGSACRNQPSYHNSTAVRHRLDLALSAGRHSAERARLAGCDLLMGRGETGWGNRRQFPPTALRPAPAQPLIYRQLAGLDCAPLSALVGMLLASAQIGLHCAAPGPTGTAATQLALALQPGLAHWLIDGPANSSPALSRCKVPSCEPMALVSNTFRC